MKVKSSKSLFIAIIILLLIGFVVASKNWNDVSQKPIPSPSPSPSPSPEASKHPSVDFGNLNMEDHISYQLPDAWKGLKEFKSVADSTDTNGNSSPYIYSTTYYYEGDNKSEKTDKIRLSIQAQKIQQTFEEYMKPKHLTNLEEIKIDGVNAIKGHYDDSNQGHFLTYRFIHNDVAWEMWIQTKDLESETAVVNEINSFVDSIKLKRG